MKCHGLFSGKITKKCFSVLYWKFYPACKNLLQTVTLLCIDDSCRNTYTLPLTCYNWNTVEWAVISKTFLMLQILERKLLNILLFAFCFSKNLGFQFHLFSNIACSGVWLTYKALITTAADDIFLSIILLLFFVYFLCVFFRENKAWYFMWIICLADDSHEISRLIFSKKKS